jgi:hypothetical protein
LEHPCSRRGQRLGIQNPEETKEATKGVCWFIVTAGGVAFASELYGFMYKYRNRMATRTATNANAKRIV